jgi:hypothetical protein
MHKKLISYLVLALLIAFPVFGQDLKTKILPFNGKLIQSDDPTQIGTNFQTLQNLRYTDSHVKGVGGMTKINSTVLSSYPHVRNAHHFNKNNPVENHVLLHTFSVGDATPVIVQSTTAIPSAGSFNEATPVISLTSSNAGFFATVPGDSIIFANGDQTLIWGGTETQIAAFMTSASTPVVATLTNPNDYSDILSNTRQAADQVATLSSSGIGDSYTSLLLHGDGNNGATTTVDSSIIPRPVNLNNGAEISIAKKKFGASSIYFDGTNDYASVAATGPGESFNFGYGNFTVEFNIYFHELLDGSYYGITGQYGATEADRSFNIIRDAANDFYVYFYSGGVIKSIKIASAAYATGTWHHFAFVRYGNVFSLYINGVSVGTPITDAGAMYASTEDLRIGATKDSAGTLYYAWGYIDEYRISKGTARYTTNFTPPTAAFGNPSNYFLVGSKRPLQGVKLYISSGNAITSTMSVGEWQGASFTPLSVTDNTASGGKTLATTGSIGWTASGAAKPRYINGLSLYWYQFYFDAGQASIYYVTIDAPMQAISNIWDGSEQLAIKCLKYDGTTYKDYSIEVADQSQSTYADFSSLATTHAIYLGFTEPQQAFDFTFVSGSENATAATTMTVSLWNGANWQTTTALNDGTMTTTTSFSKGGVASFQGAAIGGEFQTTISNEVPLYYYKIQFADTLDADVKVSEIRGIPFPQAIPPYTFATMYQSRSILLNESSQYKNKLLYSAYETADVFNGDDSGSILIGDSSEITGACTLSLVLTSALEQLIITKKNQTYRMFGNGPENWEIQLISGTTGCVAPKTMKTVSLPLDSQSNYIGRHIAIWQGSDGVYVTDGRTPSPIHNDIKNLFDKRSTTSINTSKIADSVGFIDHENLEYHWLFASGTSTTLDKEYVFDLRRWKWYEIVRGTGKQLQHGFKVTDTYGNNYNYGTIDTGYVERLEYGNDFDGGNIVHTVQFGDIAFADIPLYETRAQYVNLAMAAKSTTTNLVNYTHYVDTSLTGTTITMSPVSTGKRVANVVANINSIPGVFHSPKLTITTSNEAIGFEPLYLGYFYKIEREHLH